MIEELKALAEKALAARVRSVSGEVDALSALGLFVMRNERAILSALSAVPVLKEALEQIAARKWDTLTQGCDAAAADAKDARQALAALEPKP